MNAGAILHIHFVAHFNVMYIAANDRVEPKTALVAGHHIAHDGSIGSDKAIGAEMGRNTFYGKNDGHKFTFF
jgi:hypothetical protein